VSPFAPPAELASGAAASLAADAPLRADSDGPFLAWLPLRLPPHGAAAAAADADALLRGHNASAPSPRRRRGSAVRRALTAAAAADDAHGAHEALLAAPSWLFAGWSGVVSSPGALGVNGWWAAPDGAAAPAVALHLVGAVHKTQTLKALRFWSHAAEPPDRYARLLALRGAGGYLRAAAAAGAAAAGGADADRDAAAGAAFERAYRVLLSRLVRLALAAQRMPVLPQVPCDGRWWARDNGGGGGGGGDGAAWGGVRDRERLLPARCARADWSWRNAADGDGADADADADAPRCCYSVAFACDAHAAYAADVDAVLSSERGGAAEVEVPMEQLLAQLRGSGSGSVTAAAVARSEVGAGGDAAAVLTLALPPLPAGDNALQALRRLLPAVVADGNDAGEEGGYAASLAALAGACSRLLVDEGGCEDAGGAACEGGAAAGAA
jgi:hypothetical protein